MTSKYFRGWKSVVRILSVCNSASYNSGINFLLLPSAHRNFRSQSFCSQEGPKIMASSTTVKKKNRLAQEKSPYLLQHAENPVDWYPWGQEAFEKARNEDKLIFLSVGYSTCHWCHVMERESFENQEIAAIMNAHFVNIKVDREERPDVDSVYMAFVQVSSGHGGWPMSVFLTPDLKPVAGGTYFPPEDRYRRPGFKNVLRRLEKEWRESKADLLRTGDKIIDILKKTTIFDVKISGEIAGGSVPGEEVWQHCAVQLADSFDQPYGGFGYAPKFPQVSNLDFAFHYYAHNPENSPIFDMALHTLQMMAKGGIHDHVGKGFHRYSTDERWHVPHFEKMLYDQAQLAVAYSNAFLLTKDQQYAVIVNDIMDYVNRDLSHKEGGFYSAEDADSYPVHGAPEKKEGAFCVWTYKDIEKLLSKPSLSKPDLLLKDVFIDYFTVKPTGNSPESQQTNNELFGQNVLIVSGSDTQTASKFELSLEELKADLEESKKILYEERLKRPKPSLDDKILTSWNGLMISGCAKASQALHSEEYKNRACQAAEFVKKHLWCSEKKQLLRCCYTDSNRCITQVPEPVFGFLDDYAFLIQGLIDLYETCFDPKWLEWALELQTIQNNLFWDTEGFGYFDTAVGDAQNNLLRLKRDYDGAEPSGNSIAAKNLVRLSAIFDSDELDEKAKQLLSAFTSRMTRVPTSVTQLLCALIMYHSSPTLIYVTGKTENAETSALLKAVHSVYVPDRVLILANGAEDSVLYKKNETIKKMKAVENSQAAYTCKSKTCSLPVTSPNELIDAINPIKTVK
nr:PREDICTED: spermatogenesis-associated protein 20 [Bemisia tabaci]